ncbi:unnamed protein product [Rotaria socialis]|nr:unnamed protein product [Rotaria socialis]CAF3620762.1 unnamed protein product [Rotaria socialis]
MANINDTKLRSNEEQERSKSTKTLVIITSADNGNNGHILSCLNSTTIENFIVALNNTNRMGECQINNINNIGPFSSAEQEIPVDSYKTTNSKKRKADLTCVICGGQATGFNFEQISCESCKAFFRRNALQPIEKTKCINSDDNVLEIRCNIQYHIKHKCQRCRLLKCLQEGMRKDFIVTREKKQIKERRLEENRRSSSELINKNNNVKSENIIESKATARADLLFESILSQSSSFLTNDDWLCLSHIQNVYFSASQATPSASSAFSFELSPDRVTTFKNIIDVNNFTAIKLINFLREIPEFQQIDARDRLILVKCNLTLLLFIRYSSNFDSVRELSYDIDTAGPISLADEAFAEYFKSFFILCCGYQFNRVVLSIFHALNSIINKDPIMTQLLMIVMIFSKGLSANDDDDEQLLNDRTCIFNAQSKYTDLLFRYLMEQSSFELAVIKMTRIIEQLLKIQIVARDFQQHIKNEMDATYINPLMKSLLHLT